MRAVESAFALVVADGEAYPLSSAAYVMYGRVDVYSSIWVVPQDLQSCPLCLGQDFLYCGGIQMFILVKRWRIFS